MNRGILVISLDTEFAWGKISRDDRSEYYLLFERTYQIIERLLSLFNKYGISVTWAVVGRLVEDEQDPTNYFHRDINRYFSNITNKSIYKDYRLNQEYNSFVSRKNLIKLIKDYNESHEIASHTYNHFYADKTTSQELIDEDFLAMKEVGAKQSVTFKSIVFPRNVVGSLDCAHAYGYKCYRGGDVNWYTQLPLPQKLLGLLRFFDHLLPLSYSVVNPVVDNSSLINIPGTNLFRVYHRGLKRFWPIKMLEVKSKMTLTKAYKTKAIMHLRFHPFNFAYKEDAHFSALESVLTKASVLRDRGLLDISTMNEVANKYQC